MITVKSTKIYLFDVDNTLVFPHSEVVRNVLHKDTQLSPMPFISDMGIEFYVHLGHVEVIRELKARGHTVVVHSAGGWEWAERVVIALGLENTVDLVMSKPDAYCDDKPVGEWMPEVDRFYIPIGNFMGGKGK